MHQALQHVHNFGLFTFLALIIYLLLDSPAARVHPRTDTEELVKH